MPKRSKPFFVRWPSARNLKVGLGSPFSVSGWDTDFIRFKVSFINPDDLCSSASRSRRSPLGNH